MTTPSMSGPLAANGNPYHFAVGPLGTWYVTGALTGLGFLQDHYLPSDNSGQVDLDNAQVFLQKTDGVFQGFVQAGWYSLPALGAPYIKSSYAWDDYYGPIPQAFVKIVPNGAFSFEVGKLPTLIGDEYTFTYENMNIMRGLLWGQEPAVSRGVQVNYTQGPIAASLSWNDGFYSNHYSWISGSVAWTIDSADTLTVVGAGNTETTNVNTIAAPVTLNNEEIFNLIYTRTQGAWTISPYFQYTNIPSSSATPSASTTGVALLVNYSFDAKGPLSGFSLPFRVEYISSSGSASVLYGPGSSAWSATITPTYQYNIFFARAEYSFVGASTVTPGSGFGTFGNGTHQDRLAVEAGILF